MSKVNIYVDDKLIAKGEMKEFKPQKSPNFKDQLNHDYKRDNKLIKLAIGLFFVIAISFIIFYATCDLWN
jgi:hypothetical protein